MLVTDSSDESSLVACRTYAQLRLWCDARRHLIDAVQQRGFCTVGAVMTLLRGHTCSRFDMCPCFVDYGGSDYLRSFAKAVKYLLEDNSSKASSHLAIARRQLSTHQMEKR